MINLNTSRLHDKFKDIRYPCPAEITSELEELRHYVRRKVARENQVRRDVLAENQARSRRRLEVRSMARCHSPVRHVYC